jgi:hypothetical protein
MTELVLLRHGEPCSIPRNRRLPAGRLPTVRPRATSLYQLLDTYDVLLSYGSSETCRLARPSLLADSLERVQRNPVLLDPVREVVAPHGGVGREGWYFRGEMGAKTASTSPASRRSESRSRW